MTAPPLLQVRHLRKYFDITKGLFSRVVGHVHAVEDVSFSLEAGRRVEARESRRAGRSASTTAFSSRPIPSTSTATTAAGSVPR